jgi:organic hydroperoxide reductase OsmC/OhrA
MLISATIKNGYHQNDITVATDHKKKKITIPGKLEGQGSSINGGELLFLSIATCFCNDTYREAAKRKMDISSVEVTVSGNFGKEGEPASNIVYEVEVQAPGCTEQQIKELVRHVDKVAEIHNTLRKGVGVMLKV